MGRLRPAKQPTWVRKGNNQFGLFGKSKKIQKNKKRPVKKKKKILVKQKKGPAALAGEANY